MSDQPGRYERAVDLWALAENFKDTHVALLDNPGAPSRLGSMSYLGLYPREELRIAHGEDPIYALERLGKFTQPNSIRTVGGAPFSSGAIGYLSYELLHGIEPTVPPLAASAPAPKGDLLHLVRFGAVVAVDALRGTTEICGRDISAIMQLDELVRAAPDRAEIEPPARPTGPFTVDDLVACGLAPTVTPGEYIEFVGQARGDIAAGRHFEVCLSQEYVGATSASGRQIYEQLRRRNPAPMSAYLKLEELEILCSSPERLVGLTAAGEIETRPIKGTRPRAADEAEDRRLAEELASSPKDRAENTMIVDLARSDLGRICLASSVEVPELCVVESYASVHHLVSTVRGQIKSGVAPVDVIRACFPGGSMTGAPKVEAMKAIAEAERSPRGIFSGAIGWIGDDGAMDLNIVIRTLVKQGDQISLHTGGAITADSNPDAEYAETMDKARAPATALAAARAKLQGQSISGA